MEQKSKQLMVFLAGELRSEKNVRRLIHENNFDFYAADAGYLLAEHLEVRPIRILGDFDSAPKPNYEGIEVFPSEKDESDSEIALRLAIEAGYKDVWFIAPFGGRVDHSVANLALLLKAHCADVRLTLYDGLNKAFVLGEGTHSVYSECRYISFFSLHEESIVTLEGFKYPLKDYRLRADTPIGLSNEIVVVPAVVKICKGKLLCIYIEEDL